MLLDFIAREKLARQVLIRERNTWRSPGSKSGLHDGCSTVSNETDCKRFSVCRAVRARVLSCNRTTPSVMRRRRFYSMAFRNFLSEAQQEFALTVRRCSRKGKSISNTSDESETMVTNTLLADSAALNFLFLGETRCLHTVDDRQLMVGVK